MQAFTEHTGIAAPLRRDNVDTDAIIPSREMKAVSKHGLAAGLFAGWRYLTPGERDINPEFVLNQPAYKGSTILLAGDNFGCGSSREHAVWALLEYGIRSVIAESFGSIFYNNCVANGILPVVLPAEAVTQLADTVASNPQTNTICINLETKRVSLGELAFKFELDEGARNMLLHGLDPIGLTLLHEQAINDFEERDRQLRAWAYPAGDPS